MRQLGRVKLLERASRALRTLSSKHKSDHGFSGAEITIPGDFQGLTGCVCEQPNLDSVLALL